MGTTGYSDGINHDEFWQWCRERVYDGHKVYISEYQAPDDFITIREKPIQNRISLNKKKLPRDYLFMKDNFKTEIMKKRSLKEEIEYRLGMYFGIKSGALYVRDDKFGNTEEILSQLQRDITRDVNFLSRKTLGYVSEEQDFKSICAFYKTKLMK